MCRRCPSTRTREQATGCLAAVQTINHRQWQVDYDRAICVRALLGLGSFTPGRGWKRLSGATEGEEGRKKRKLLSQSRVKYCCLTGSRGESVLYCNGRRAPIWRKISPRSSLYASMTVKPKPFCEVGNRIQAVMCNQKTQIYKCMCLGRLIWSNIYHHHDKKIMFLYAKHNRKQKSALHKPSLQLSRV